VAVHPDGKTKNDAHRFADDDEYDELATAARNAGLTPACFCARAALDTTRNLHTTATTTATIIITTAERVGRQALAACIHRRLGQR
jgi:hypothetical protein